MPLVTAEVVVIFVMIILDLVFCVVGGYLLPFVGGCFSFLFSAILANEPYAASVMFSPYLQLMLVVVGVVCFLKGVLTAKGVFD